MYTEIDKYSGFCFGVVYAIKRAEEILEEGKTKLYCLGDIVHNTIEVERLVAKGLMIITHEEFKSLKDVTVLIRAHGEPPETYKIALENNITLIDASCPVVLKLQNRIRKGYTEISEKNGQIVIYGKEGHAEVNGLVGQTDGNAIIIGSELDLNKINYNKPVYLYSQTTQNVEKYKTIAQIIKSRMKDGVEFVFHDTICRLVSQRVPRLKKFVERFDMIIFVSDHKSSNGKYLFEMCKNFNDNSFFVYSEKDIKKEWFSNVNSVGITGATSTPRWLMEMVEKRIKEMFSC